jgi:2-polyprenyl-6-methoxyphenol hydroxylase-like FAD-dependent oxidoreductase
VVREEAANVGSAYDILIVGGGIAGLSAAIALGNRGMKTEIIEAGGEPLGAAIGVHGWAIDALGELGVLEACIGRATMLPIDAPLRDAAGEPIVQQAPRTGDSVRPSFGIYRPTLLGILRDAAVKVGASIRYGATIQSIRDEGDGTSVRLSDGTLRHCHLLIGADGIHSHVRTLLFDDAPIPIYAGQYAIRWMAPGPPLDGPGWFLSPTGKLGGYFVPEGFTYVVSVLDRASWTRMEADETYETMSRHLDSYSAPYVVELRRRLKPDSELICRPFEWLLVPQPWSRGRTLLIGDAAHATTAHMAMGGGMAIEDGVVLGQCVSDSKSIPEAIDAFTARRFGRCRKVVETSLALSRLEQSRAAPAEIRAVAAPAFAALNTPY